MVVKGFGKPKRWTCAIEGGDVMHKQIERHEGGVPMVGGEGIRAGRAIVPEIIPEIVPEIALTIAARTGIGRSSRREQRQSKRPINPQASGQGGGLPMTYGLHQFN